MLRCIQTLNHGQGKVWSLAWSPAGDMLVSCGEDKEVKIWHCNKFSKDTYNSESPPSWTLGTKLESMHERTIRDVTWSPCGHFLATASFDATANIWKKSSNPLEETSFSHVATVDGHENEVKSIAWAPSGDFFATCGRDKTVMVWSFSSEQDYEVECECVLVSHSQDVKRVIWQPNQDKLASASYDNTLKMFEIDADQSDWNCSTTLEGHDSTVWGLDFEASGNRLASCSADKTVKIWEKKSNGSTTKDNPWSCVCTIGNHHRREIYDVSWNKLNGLIATGGGDNCIRIFKEASGGELNRNIFEFVSSTRAHDGDVNRVEWNNQVNGLIASAGDDGNVKLWTLVDQ